MGDNKGDTSKKQPQQQQTQQQQQISPSPNDPLEDQLLPTEITRPRHHQQQPPPAAAPFNIPAPLFVPSGAATSSSSPFDQQHFEAAVNPKRPRYTTGQWKLLPSPSSQTKQTQIPILAKESTPSPNPKSTQLPQPHVTPTRAASSSDTASSPPAHSPLPSLSATSGQDTNKTEGDLQNPVHNHQFRKGKYVSPVWKPNEMLWLARGWRIQYQGGPAGGSSDHGSGSSSRTEQIPTETGTPHTRSKTRADKDREVAEFLQKHGVNRDAKTAGTKWDNMLGEFRKVYEWERGAEREQVGKSYFRLSPYERKLHRLPASFDEEVFEELSQFMGSRMRTPQSRLGSVGDDSRSAFVVTRSLTQPPSFKEDEFPPSGSKKQLMIMSGGGEPFYHGGRGTLLGFHHHDQSSLDFTAGLSSSSASKELRRIGKIRMTWEELVSLWAEEGEHHRGRVRLQGSSFLNADELTFFDDSMVASTMEAFEDGPLRGFSVDRFVSGQVVKVFGRRKPSSSTSGFNEKVQLSLPESASRSIPSTEFQDPTEYYVGCLGAPPPSLPSLPELQWYLQEPPPEELRFPLRKDVYRDLPQGKEIFFTTSTELLDCRAITYDILSPIIRTNPSLSASTATSRDSFIPIWDDCINRLVSKFCSLEMVFIRRPNASSPTEPLQDQWPNVTGFVRSFCLWRGEETDQLRDSHDMNPSSSIVEKILWTYMDLPYIFGYYAIGYVVTFCALSRSQDRINRTDLATIDLSSPSERLKALVPCYRIAGLLPLLADRCFNNTNCNKLLPHSDFERRDLGNGRNIVEMTPTTVTRFFSNVRKWTAVKEIYDFLDHRIPHAEFIHRSLEKDLGLVFKPRGCKCKPTNCEQLVEALKYVTKALVALHDLSFMHRDISWEKVMRRTERENEWFVCGFEEAVGAPQIYPRRAVAAGESAARVRHAPEMERGLHGVKVDVWGVGYLVRNCGLTGVPKMLRELQNRCLDQNPEQRPTAADCYHHLLQLQSSLQSATAGCVLGR
ncbi:PREDICTED: Crinkler (CRN) family [Prunus dulcis]|uniref:PREDICTED: Crinkler (CRN) family n=1 Tax=Prunus dulcis TaxID=3755 RepID=A0A5E4E8G6_PRUDU|nr:uncharacterized protein LOC117619129 isoform X1 [Prunus dulcis]VVA11011.1 PREDICTED: Crinkler (CRN) family [Prunus dulcis]